MHAALLRAALADRAGWRRLQGALAALISFDSVGALLSHLRDPGTDLDSKDRIYFDLIRELRTGSAAPRLARDLLWLGLWCSLDGAARHHRARSPRNEDALSDIGIAIMSLLREHDLGRVRRLAATLVLNTERALVDARRRAERQRQRDASLVELHSIAGVLIAPRGADGLDAIGGDQALLQQQDPDQALLALWAIGGLTYDEIARRLGISASWTRKRIGRARSALRRKMAAAKKSEKTWGTFSDRTRDLVDVSQSEKLVKARRCPNHWPPSTQPGATRQVGTSWYCAPCAAFLLRPDLHHLRGWSCHVTGDEGPGICPACLYEAFMPGRVPR